MARCLDDEMLEWRILDAVRPLFAAISWDLSAPQSDLATEINIDKEKSLFKYEMGEMRVRLVELSECEIPEHSFQLCLRRMSELLGYFESLLGEQVFETIPNVISEPELKEACLGLSSAMLPSEDAGTLKLPKPSIWGYIKTLVSPAPANPPLLLASTENSSKTPIYTKPADQHKYPKLQALKNIILTLSTREGELLQSCSNFVHSKITLDKFKSGLRKATVFNRSVGSLSQSRGRTGQQPAGLKNVPKSNWESKVPWNLSNRLFESLLERSCGHHRTKLQLDGFRLDTFSNTNLKVDIFVSSCAADDDGYWQECRCISFTETPMNLDSNGPETLTVHKSDSLMDLCGSIRETKGSTSRILSIEFEAGQPDPSDDELWYSPTKTELSPHNGAAPLVSLKQLLEGGCLGKMASPKNVFNMNDKAILTLSLARCFLHLVQSSWFRSSWSSGSIHFLTQQNDKEIIDIHHPYWCAALDEIHDVHNATSESMEHMHLILLSFAKLLIEIETGEQIDSDITPEDCEDIIVDILDERQEEFGREDYNNAVNGCLKFKAQLNKVLKEEPNHADDPMYLVRKVLYDTVIKFLERNFDQIPGRVKNLVLGTSHSEKRLPSPGFSPPRDPSKRGDNSRRKTTAHEAQNQEASTPPANPASRRQPQQSSIISILKKSPPKIIFFDGESISPNDISVARADRFFDLFDKFRQQSIIPKLKDFSGRRIRIAILDTGIDKNNPDVRALRNQIFESRRGPRSGRNPLQGIASFTGILGDEDGNDTFGHGTHVASLVLKTAPHADLYIAKVSSDKYFDNSNAVVKAIEWAIAKEVDIITMSFGFKYRDLDIEEAIHSASNRKPHEALLFAAASNSGINSERTFPATDRRVIGVHSLDGFGNDNGGLNPLAEGYHDRFGTLGLGIKTIWDGKVEYKSGSSYATPIAAGIAANCLIWLDHLKNNGRLTEKQYASLRRHEGIHLMFEKQAPISKDLLSVAPWTLWKDESTEDLENTEEELPKDTETDSVVLGVLKSKLQPVK